MQINVPDHILFEDEYILVINKPAGLMVEPDRNGHPNLLHQVRRYIKESKPPGEEVYAQHIHRLDRPVSGVILFAKQRSVLKNLSEQFAERRVKKYYQAITENAPIQRAGTLDKWLRKEKKKAVIYDAPVEYAERAQLKYEITEESDNRFLWNIELQTGKYHQIRAQLANDGCPILGDNLYGSVVSYGLNHIALHAHRLIFRHPVENSELNIVVDFDFKKKS